MANEGSFSRAASKMGRDQSTISNHIKNLEQEFGITLFDRSGGHVELTEEGSMFLEKTLVIYDNLR